MSRCKLFGIERPVNHKSIVQTSLRLRVRFDFRLSRKGLMQIERRFGMRSFFVPLCRGTKLMIPMRCGKICQENAARLEHAPDFLQHEAACCVRIGIEQTENTEYRIKVFFSETESQEIALHQRNVVFNKRFFLANVKHRPANIRSDAGLLRISCDFLQHSAGAAAGFENAARTGKPFVQLALNERSPSFIINQFIKTVVMRCKGIVEFL